MNYHLNQNGHSLGEFPLEELHRRRVAGELTGSEIVWCEGMVQWQTLDVVLQQKLPGAIRPLRPVQPPPKSNLAVKIIGIVLSFVVCGAVALGVFWFKFVNPIRKVLSVAHQVQNDSNSGPTALELASQPIAWNSNTLTSAEAMTISREFRLRQWLTGYKQQGEHDTDADARSLELIGNWIGYNYGGTYDTNLPSLVEMSNKLAEDPSCSDPLVLTVVAVNSPLLSQKVQRLERAVKGFEHSKHLGYPKFYATVVLADALAEQRHPERVAALDTQALQYLREAFKDGSITPDDQEQIGEIMVFTFGTRFFKSNGTAVYSMVQDCGKKYKWLALALKGEFEINEAWRIRGSGYADSVTPEAWKGFSQHLDLAEKYLTEAWKLNPKLPLAPDAMIKTSLGQDNLAGMRRWFDRTLAAQVDFEDAWTEMRWGLRPRWHGDLDSMLALGITAIKTHHYETRVPQKFLDSLHDVETEMQLPVGTHIYGRPDVWPRLQEMYEGYIAEPNGDAANRNGWRSHYAIVAYLAGRYDVASRQLQALGGPLAAQDLTGWGVDLTLMPMEVAARTGDQSNAVVAAELNRDAGEFESAWQQYRALSALTNLDDQTRSFVQERLATLTLENRLKTHQWVDYLPTDTNFSGWCLERGDFTLQGDGALDVHSGRKGHLLYSRARLGVDFEVRGQFEIERNASPAFQAGLVMGTPQYENYNWYAFRLKRTQRNGDMASFGRHWSSEEVEERTSLDRYTNTFYFRFQAGKASASVNNQEVLKEVTPDWGVTISTNECLLGLGGFNEAGNDTVIRYRNVQARSLAASPTLPATK